MTSEEPDDLVSKSFLQRIHQQQLAKGITYDQNQNYIVVSLGGIDNVLSLLLSSNPIMTRKQMHDIHQIITKPMKSKPQRILAHNPKQYKEDKGYTQNIELVFNDNDTFLFEWFGKATADTILQWMKSKYIKCLLALILSTLVILGGLSGCQSQSHGTLNDYLVSLDVVYAFWSFLCLFYSLYIIMWISYSNKEGLKLLITSFEFLFKMCYLILFLISYVGFAHFDRNVRPFYFRCTTSVLFASFSFFVMIFDAMNIPRSTKVVMSCFAEGLFLWMTLLFKRMLYFVDKYPVYDEAKLTIMDTSGFGTLQISLVQIAANSGQILSIFLLKQLVLSIVRPDRATVICRKPIIKFEDKSDDTPQQKTIRFWRIVCVSHYCFLLLWFINDIVSTLRGNYMDGKSAFFMNVMYSYYIVLFVLFIISFSLFIINNIHCVWSASFCRFVTSNIRCIWGAIIIVFILFVINVMAVFFLDRPQEGTLGILLLFSFDYVYLSKLVQFGSLETNIKEELTVSTQITSNQIHPVICTNIDWEESI
eukprot:37926_1